VPLRPLVVLTGSIHRDGGSGKWRREGNVVTTTWMRRVRQARQLKTPYGTLFLADQLPEVQKILAGASAAALAYNQTARAGGSDCRVWNYMLWEELAGNRATAAEAWIRAQARDDAGVREIFSKLRASKASMNTEAPVETEAAGS
jgi:hypothetical protein